jgi:ribonuclease HI
MPHQFLCKQCGSSFSLPPATLKKFPSWNPSTCMKCKKSASSREENLTKQEVLEKYTAGPTSGVFTDGAAEPNPGPGGWGVVYVVNNEVIAEESGHEPHTTNNRMELMGLLAAFRVIPKGAHIIVYSDSELCVKTFTEWAKNWEAQGWTRGKKKEAIKNLELVQEVYEILQDRPEITLKWIKAHAGNRWNEYADALATGYRKI